MINQLKIQVKIYLRYFNDFFNGDYFRFARKAVEPKQFDFSHSFSQKIMPSETYENKVFNLALAAQRINNYTILPNQLFSFWKIVGNPNRDFKKGRTLINGKLTEENGGGLCQVSGIIYQIALQVGLEIKERYNHSVDIYTEETRFAPLGTDATVVYGYKDLRFKNNFDFPIRFNLQIVDNLIFAEIQSTQPIHKKQLLFELNEAKDVKTVIVNDENQQLLNKSVYKKT